MAHHPEDTTVTLPVCTLAASAHDVLPELAAVGVEPRRIALRPAALAELTDAETVLIDGREDLPTASALCRGLARRRPSAPVLVVPEGVLVTLGGGLQPAQFLLPDAGRAEIRMRLGLARSARRRSTAVRVGALALHRDTRRAVLHGRELPVSAREFAVLDGLAAPAGRVRSRDELLEHAWGSRWHDASAVGTVVRRLRAAFGPHADALVAVRGVGYRLDIAPLHRCRQGCAAG